jgi:3-deoxy-D-manno-octulosonate 8-phosphate phosphatase (KDO 8-P phosphatase)
MLKNLDDFRTIIFDFDGVFTDNRVIVDDTGREFVSCDRRDGLGISLLKNFARKMRWDVEMFILSTEKNTVVQRRAQKLDIDVHHGCDNKLEFMMDQYCGHSSDSKPFKSVIYLGNDLNDLEVMKRVGLSVAPVDAHPNVIEIADIVIDRRGGDGFVREFVEKLIRSVFRDPIEFL